MPGEECCLPRVDVGLAGQVEIERLEPFSGLQQQRGSVAAQAGGERDPPAQQVRSGGLKLVQRPGLSGGQEVAGLAERARLHVDLRCFQRALGSSPRVRRQRGRTFQERGGGGQAAAGLRPPGGLFQFGGDLLVRLGRRFGQVPGPPVRVSAGVADRGQGGMRMAPAAAGAA